MIGKVFFSSKWKHRVFINLMKISGPETSAQFSVTQCSGVSQILASCSFPLKKEVHCLVVLIGFWKHPIPQLGTLLQLIERHGSLPAGCVRKSSLQKTQHCHSGHITWERCGLETPAVGDTMWSLWKVTKGGSQHRTLGLRCGAWPYAAVELYFPRWPSSYKLPK